MEYSLGVIFILYITKSTHCSDTGEMDEHAAALWLLDYNDLLFIHANEIAETAWGYSTNISDYTQNNQVTKTTKVPIYKFLMVFLCIIMIILNMKSFFLVG